MKIIRKIPQLMKDVVGVQKPVTEKKYRFLKYVRIVDNDQVYLLYNYITGEFLAFGKNEIDFNELSKESDLIEKWFVVPEDFKDVEFSDQITQVYGLIGNNVRASDVITNYTVMTTTDCNARCFYCYELGRSRIPMSDQVALDTAKYMIKKSKDNKISIRWFGGEPLYNQKAIDIICTYLKENGKEFITSMVSNGYLFNDENIAIAKDLWNLNKVQITLDGTEDVYNRCKAYIYKDEISPYKRVMSNIAKLLQADISVTIRLNVDKHNVNDLYELCDILFDSFGKYPNFMVYAHMLFDNSETYHKTRSELERVETLYEYNKFNAYLETKGMLPQGRLGSAGKIHFCMANNPKATLVMPDGRLGKCEHFSESDAWGSIYNDDIDMSAIAKFSEIRGYVEACYDCQFRPACVVLKACPNNPEQCEDIDRQRIFEHTDKTMKKIYQKWLLNNATEKEEADEIDC